MVIGVIIGVHCRNSEIYNAEIEKTMTSLNHLWVTSKLNGRKGQVAMQIPRNFIKPIYIVFKFGDSISKIESNWMI